MCDVRHLRRQAFGALTHLFTLSRTYTIRQFRMFLQEPPRRATTPRVCQQLLEHTLRNASQPYQHRRIIAVMIGGKEHGRFVFQKTVTLVEGPRVHHEHGIIIAEAREELSGQLERRHPVTRAFFDAGQAKHELANDSRRDSSLSGLFRTSRHRTEERENAKRPSAQMPGSADD